MLSETKQMLRAYLKELNMIDMNKIEPVLGIAIPSEDFKKLQSLVEESWFDETQNQILIPLDANGTNWILILERRQ